VRGCASPSTTASPRPPPGRHGKRPGCGESARPGQPSCPHRRGVDSPSGFDGCPPLPDTDAPPVDSKLTTVGLPYQEWAKPLKNGYLGLVPPGMQDGGGLELGESFALPILGLVWSFPAAADAGRSQGHRIGARGPTEATRSRVHGLYHPSTRSRHYCLSVAIWEGFPLYRLLHAGPAGEQYQEGDKSEEALPWHRSTYNPLQVVRREIESAHGR
jgi:hypothetical protein